MLDLLAQDPWPANLDVKPLTGAGPWFRVRTGDYRMIFRPLTARELTTLGWSGRGFYIGRIVHRRDLERIIATL